MSESWHPTTRTRDAKAKQQAMTLLGGCCEVCGEDDIRCLTVDHIVGTPLSGGDNMRSGISLYRAIVAGTVDSTELQILCANHNAIKRVEAKEHRGYKKARGLT